MLHSDAQQPRVALVHDWLTGMRGGEKVLEKLCELYPEAPIFTLFHFPGTASETIEGHPIHTSFLQRAPGLERHYRRYLPLFPTAIESFDLSAYDLILSTSHCVAKGVKAPKAGHHVCYCHTPMRYAWDQRQVYFPKRDLASLARDPVLAALRRWDRSSSSRVDTFIANSNFVRQRIHRYYGREAVVIPPPVDINFFDPPSSPTTGDRPFALMVAAFSPYKRLDVAIAACEQLDLELHIVGSGPERQRVQQTAGAGIRFLGRLAAQDLRSEYRRAACLLQPGVEDFGIASVEALACGCPVVALGQGGVLDIVDDGVHGVLFEASNLVSNLVQAVDKALQSDFNKLNLRRRSVRFSETEFDHRIRDLLQSTQASIGELI